MHVTFKIRVALYGEKLNLTPLDALRYELLFERKQAPLPNRESGLSSRTLCQLQCTSTITCACKIDVDQPRGVRCRFRKYDPQ